MIKFSALICAFAMFLSLHGKSIEKSVKWDNLKWHTNFKVLNKHIPSNPQTRFKVASDRNFIYFMVEALEPAMDKLVTKKQAYPDDFSIWSNDGIEIGISNDRKYQKYYKIAIDNAGQHADCFARDDNTGRNMMTHDSSFESNVKVETKKTESSYIIYAAIPFGAFDYNDDDMADNWKFNIARVRRAGLPQGKMEFTSYADLKGSGFAEPWSFANLPVRKIDRRKFAWTVNNIKAVKDAENRKNYNINFTLANKTGAFRIVYFDAELSNRSKKFNVKLSGTGVPDSQFKNISLPFKNLPEGEYELNVRILARGDVLQKAFSVPVVISHNPLKLQLLKPAYRNNIYATMPDKGIVAVLSSGENSSDSNAFFTLKGANVNIVKKAKITNGKASVSFDGARLADGEYILTAAYGSYSQKVTIRKLPYQKNEVWLDRYGITYVDGKKYFPFGWFGNAPVNKVRGINSYVTYTRFNDAGHYKRDFEKSSGETERMGLLYPFQELSGRFDYKDFNYNQRLSNLNDVQKKHIEKFVKLTRPSANVLAYYLADEPDIRQDNPDWYTEVKTYLQQLDPYHPTVMLNCTTSGIKRYRNTADILFPDYYPDFYEDGPRQALHGMAVTVKTAAQFRPAWSVIQGFAWLARSVKTRSPGRAPTYAEIRNQVYNSIASNAKGILFYHCYDKSQMFSSLRFGMNFMANEIDILKDYLLDPNIPDKVSVKSADPHFQCAYKTLDGRICIIAVNNSYKTITADITVKNPALKKLFAAAENRTITLNNGKFTDTFEPCAVHVYINDEKIADKLTTVAENEKKLADFDKNRKKAGNILAVGELKVKHIRHVLTKEPLPYGFPKIKASTEHKEYFSRGYDTPLFLIDGICENIPLDAHMCYRPRRNDKNPMLTFTLPQAEEIGKLVIYPVEKISFYCSREIKFDVGISGSVQVMKDGKWTEIAKFNNASAAEKVIVNFAPQKIKEFKLVFNSSNFALSEIEAYRK